MGNRIILKQPFAFFVDDRRARESILLVGYELLSRAAESVALPGCGIKVEYEMKVVEVNSMSKRYRVGAVCLCLSCAVFSVVAQQPAATAPGVAPVLSSSAKSPSSNDRSFLLDVVVTDKSGKSVAGLQQQEFTVLDDSQPTKILSFRAHSTAGMPSSAVDASTDVILILDEVNAPFEKVTYAKDEIEKFLRQNNGQLVHPVTLAFLTDSGLQMQTQPSADGNALAAALDQQGRKFRTVERGTMFEASDRLQMSQNALDSLISQEQTKPGRKMVIWISPGWPLLSGRSIVLTSDQMQRIFHSVVRLSAGLRQARITMYSINPLGLAGVGGVGTTFYENFTKGLTKPDKAELGDLGLQVLDTQTGGRAIFGNDMIERSIDQCVSDLSSFYTLSIEAAPSERADDYHGLDVKMGSTGLKARTRTGYYAQP